MTRSSKRLAGPHALDLVEQAVHLLRRESLGLLFLHFLSAAPFVLGLLYFWADMSRGAFAEERCTTGALGLALLFVWMKTGQTVFCVELRARVAGKPAGRWTLRRLTRVALTQAALQPLGLPLLVVSFVIAVPFGWVFAMAQSLTALDGAPEGGIRGTWRRAWRQAFLWPGQNHLLLVILGGFGLVVWLNFMTGLLAIPWLLKTFLGVETPFSMSFSTMFNTTFLASSAGLAWLAVDPILKAAYTLRCFRGESFTTGEDLRAELASIAWPRAAALTLVALWLCCPAPLAAAAQPAPAAAAATLDERELNRAIDEVLSRREYSWRLPRERREPDEREPSWIARQFKSLLDALERIVLKARDLLFDILDWLGRKFRGRSHHPVDPSAWVGPLHVMVFVLLAVVLSVLAVLVLRAWRRRRNNNVVVAQAVAATPDLRDENVGADQLPEDGWLRLAREYMAGGEFRLALRAFYLASLAHLAAREFVQLARFKSNRDYEREVLRRARAQPAVPPAFSANVTAFDRAWYGRHEVSTGTLAEFERNFDRIRSL